MKVHRLGDSALILYDLPVPAADIVRYIEAEGFPGLREAVASYESVGLYFEAARAPGMELAALIEKLKECPPPNGTACLGPKLHEVPVCYEMGEDLSSAAQDLGIDSETLIAEHCSMTYTCFAIGFCPGFPYLGYLPSNIAGVPRRGRPRVRVDPGSVGITGKQTGIYPTEIPGGWALIGRTPLEIVDVADGYFPISAGDRVGFIRIDAIEYGKLLGERL